MHCSTRDCDEEQVVYCAGIAITLETRRSKQDYNKPKCFLYFLFFLSYFTQQQVSLKPYCAPPVPHNTWAETCVSRMCQVVVGPQYSDVIFSKANLKQQLHFTSLIFFNKIQTNAYTVCCRSYLRYFWMLQPFLPRGRQANECAGFIVKPNMYVVRYSKWCADFTDLFGGRSLWFLAWSWKEVLDGCHTS